MVERVTLYRAPSTVVDADEIATWLDTHVSASVEVNDRFLERCEDDDGLTEGFARARVLSPYDRSTGNTMLGIVRYEARVMADPKRGGGVLYDGLAIQSLLRRHITGAERHLDHLHIILLDRALGTWGDHDGRWHKRVSVLGQPTLISVPGLYEAPAKPEAYYQTKQQHALIAGGSPPREVLEAAVEGDFLVENDSRTTEALKGYVLQAYHYLATGVAFCEKETCRLHNAHYHEDLIRAQLEEPSFCDEHASRYA